MNKKISCDNRGFYFNEIYLHKIKVVKTTATIANWKLVEYPQMILNQ